MSSSSDRQPQVTLTLDRQDAVYVPGDVVNVTVVLRPAQEVRPRAVTARFVCTELYQYQITTSTTDSNGNSIQQFTDTWGTDELFVQKVQLLDETTLPADIARQFSVQFHIPDDALPSCYGAVLKIVWQVQVNLDFPWASDLNTAVELKVPSRQRPATAHPGEYGQSNEPDEAAMDFLLSDTVAVVGQQLQGNLRITPHRNFTARVRLELERFETVSHGSGNQKTQSYPLPLMGNTNFRAGQQQIIPFQIAIPHDAAPSILTSHGAISWKLKGILDRSWRKDTLTEAVIEVYSSL